MTLMLIDSVQVIIGVGVVVAFTDPVAAVDFVVAFGVSDAADVGGVDFAHVAYFVGTVHRYL